jgi:hypothetical protein
MTYELKTKAGSYKSDNLFKLFFIIISHRFSHLLKDGKWMD